MKLHWSPPGEISKDGCWCLWHDCYLYTHDTVLGVLWLAIKEWKQDRHLVG